MEEKNSCLVLEGGALRGVYTAGVQGVLHRANLVFDALIGTSAGAMNGINYLTDQPERSFHIDHYYAPDKNFMGLRPLLRERQIFSFRYLFGPVCERFPLDIDVYTNSKTRFIAVATALDSGEPAYLERANCSDMLQALQASSSMPLLSTAVSLDNHLYLDGGPSMPVPYRKALQEGYQKIVLVLTRHKGYRKKPLSSLTHLAVRRKFGRKYPAFLSMMEHSPMRYNAMMDEIDRLEADGILFVIRPSQPVLVSRTEKNQKKLEDLFKLGQADAESQLSALLDFLTR